MKKEELELIEHLASQFEQLLDERDKLKVALKKVLDTIPFRTEENFDAIENAYKTLSEFEG